MEFVFEIHVKVRPEAAGMDLMPALQLTLTAFALTLKENASPDWVEVEVHSLKKVAE